MTVKELIEKLQALNAPDLRVVALETDETASCGHGDIDAPFIQFDDYRKEHAVWICKTTEY